MDLYIDFDGVIMDTINVTYELLKKLQLTSEKPEDEEKRRTFYSNLDWKNLLEITPVINDGLNCIQKIIDSKLFNVSILTHINSLNEAVEKVKFLRNYFKDITIIPVPIAISKTKMVHTKGAILIDDYTNNLREWKMEGGIGIRFSSKLNGKGFMVINKLDQIIDMYPELEAIEC